MNLLSWAIPINRRHSTPSHTGAVCDCSGNHAWRKPSVSDTGRPSWQTLAGKNPRTSLLAEIPAIPQNRCWERLVSGPWCCTSRTEHTMISTAKTAEQICLWTLPLFCSSGNSNFCMMTVTRSLMLCPNEWRCHEKHGSEAPSFHILAAWFMSSIPDELCAGLLCTMQEHRRLQPSPTQLPLVWHWEQRPCSARRTQPRTAPTTSQRYHRAPKSWLSQETAAAPLPLSQSSLLPAHSCVEHLSKVDFFQLGI